MKPSATCKCHIAKNHENLFSSNVLQLKILCFGTKWNKENYKTFDDSLNENSISKALGKKYLKVNWEIFGKVWHSGVLL
jgi:hypothetical protein